MSRILIAAYPPINVQSNMIKRIRRLAKHLLFLAFTSTFDERNHEYRGSNVHLDPGTTYEIKLSYGNFISHCWDDGVESEGANRNVRIWGNHIDKTFVKIATACTSVGPLYIWCNIANTSRKSAMEPDSDLYGRGRSIKAGGKNESGIWYGSGRTYVFHNMEFGVNAFRESSSSK